MEMEDVKVNVVATGEELVLRHGKASDLFRYEGFQYKAEGTSSFASLVKSKAAKEHCVVFNNSSGYVAILDDRINTRPHDTVSMSHLPSIQMGEWSQIMTKGKVFDIKGMADFLKRRNHGEIDGIEELLYAVQNFKYVTNVTGDFSFEDRNNYTFNVKIAEAETTVKVPKSIVVHLEIYKGSEFFQDVEVEIEVNRPKDQSEKPGFLLQCPTFDRHIQVALESEARRMKELLPGFLVVDGAPS